MTYEPVVLPQAEADIAEAFAYLTEFSADAAERWYRRVKSAINSLSEMPARCPLAPEAIKLGLDVRHLLDGRRPRIYRIVFRILEDVREVHILAVRHGARKPLSDEELHEFLQQI